MKRIDLRVDCDVLASPASGVAVYLREILRELEANPDFSVFRRPRRQGSARASPPWRASLRLMPAAYAVRALRAGWPPVPERALFWAPNFLLPSWPLVPRLAVVSIHDTIFLDHPEWADPVRGRFFRRALPATLRKASAVIVPSEGVAARLREIYPEVHCQTISSCGIRRLPPVTPRTRRSVLCLGNVEPRKSIETLVQAYRGLPGGLQHEHPLIIAGHIADPAYARALGVTIQPRPDDAELSALFAEASVVVTPSLAEGTGLVPLEAYVSGASVLASDLPFTREALGDRVAYFTPGSVAELRIGLERLLRSPPMSSELERQQLAAKFTWKASAAAHADLFRRLTGVA